MITFDNFEFQYTNTKERREQELEQELRQIKDDYLNQFEFKDGDPIEYDGEYIGLFESLEWDGEEVLLSYRSNEIPGDVLCSLNGINPDRLSIHYAA